MVFLFVVLIIILLLVVVSYSNLELDIINIDFNSQNKKKINSNYKYIIRLKILSKITILKITFTQNKIEKILSKIDVDKKIEKLSLEDIDNDDAPMLPMNEDPEDEYDLQKELEAKFDELFGPIDDDN